MPNPYTSANSNSSRFKRALELLQELERTEAELHALLGFSNANGTSQTPKVVAESSAKRTMSAAGRARIAAAQRARWAKQKSETQESRPAGKKKRTMSSEARAKIAAAQKKRWAKQKGGK